MKRLFSVITVVAVAVALMMVMATPGFARAEHRSAPGDLDAGAGKTDCEIHAVITPSDNINLRCHAKHEGVDSGGSGGGGAYTARGTGGIGGFPADAQAVQTPSGNGKLTAHYHPDEN